MNANYEYFLQEQNNFANVATAYKNNPEFKKSVDHDARVLLALGVASFDGEVEVVWNDDMNYHLILPVDPNVMVNDETINYIAAAKAQEGEYQYYTNNYLGQLYRSENRVTKAESQGTGATKFIRLDKDGNVTGDTLERY